MVTRGHMGNEKHVHYHNTCEDQTWLGGDLSWGASTHKDTWPIKHMVTWAKVKIRNKSTLS